MENRVLIEDTRQQKGKHDVKNEWWKRHGIRVERKKLDFGDYSIEGSNIVVDTKQNLSEVVGDCGRDHARFAREMERAREAGYRLVILIENTYGYESIEDVAEWLNDMCRRCRRRRDFLCDPERDKCERFRSKPMSGATLARIMARMEEHHGSWFRFCHPFSTARMVCDILGVRYETGH